MKKKVRTPWIEFFKTGRFYKYIEALDEDNHLFKELKKKPKLYYWQLSIFMYNGNVSSLTTINPDTEDWTGENSYDELLEWFQCSDNPSYVFRFDDGLKVFVRDAITEIQVIKKEKK